jgi:hypothetical protein
MLDEHQFDPTMSPALREAFYDFISRVTIDSKDSGPVALEPFYGQRRMVDEIFSGLEDDIHWFVVLKARQLGITTVSLLLDIFWVSYFPGLQGALVTDTEPNKNKIRVLIQRILESLPASHAVPVMYNRKDGLVLTNGSTLDYLVAGTRKNGGLGRSRAYNFLHATECSSWGDQQGLESLQKTLTQRYPARLYIFESTAIGFNIFHSMWEDAKEDPMMKKGIFIGWWAKEDYAFVPSRSLKEAQLFERYSKEPISDEEAELIEYVKREYDFEVTLEQLAWYRHEKDPAGDGTIKLENTESILEQEMPWHEEQAFMVTGSHFFPGTDIKTALKAALKKPYKGYKYFMGENFATISIEQTKTEKQTQLKIWEEPVPGALYIIGADPAYGSGDGADKFCIEIFRAYADGMDQVAEFTSPHIKTYQFAWIIAHLCGVYGNARFLLELNGPGEAVLVEFRNLSQMLQNGLIHPKDQETTPSIKNILASVKTYLYTKQDVFSGNAAPHWRTSFQNKVVILNQFRDCFTLGQIKVVSTELLSEMEKIVQNGLEIKGDGNAKDDRVIASALATRAWIDNDRKTLQSQHRTRDTELNKVVLSQSEMNSMFTHNIMADFFARQQAQRTYNSRQARRGSRWNW